MTKQVACMHNPKTGLYQVFVNILVGMADNPTEVRLKSETYEI